MFFVFLILFIHACHCPPALQPVRDPQVYAYNNLGRDLRNVGFNSIGAVRLLTEICKLQEDNEGMVNVAINTQLNTIMAWDNYMNTVGTVYGNRHAMFAAPGWDTFRGSCVLLASRSWAQGDPIESGLNKANKKWFPVTRTLRLPVEHRAFECTTSLTWWEAQFGNVHKLRTAFRSKMRGLPEEIWVPWEGVPIDKTFTLQVAQKFDIPACSIAWLTSTTVRRHVVAVPAFQVEQYNSIQNGYAWRSQTWMNLGVGYQTVYADRDPIECHALTAQLPNGLLANVSPQDTRMPDSYCPRK
jgi:hypothetical protein